MQQSQDVQLVPADITDIMDGWKEDFKTLQSRAIIAEAGWLSASRQLATIKQELETLKAGTADKADISDEG